MNAKTFLLAILAFFLLISVVSAAELPPKKVKPPKRGPKVPKAPPSKFILEQKAKKAAKKLNTPKIPPKGSDEIPKTRDEL
ncbi:hypothetical protein H8356DRAFT_1718242 [Neocallimastix lanati (nom. inval.)]|jgi:hypothetical protein|uniref:Uncharacterized protein n=1 Tax=Neocallimastix californiae TaxID=1754190 RepID=A0A1Y2DHM9_9FUNG|nr:hypothetical protein H8356DRAFT_1718242 [Neocallimastix sp. JGI-2020a]ORY58624.1 hypothetical protein LY90DRAFT_701519 [Neocallimastix californiae]|eukprot:ORY58624.1 hypothetical protein LY90DRAFT_701519 [Neocallimastix californiae]